MTPKSRIEIFKNAAPGTRVSEIMPPRRPKANYRMKPREGKRK